MQLRFLIWIMSLLFELLDQVEQIGGITRLIAHIILEVEEQHFVEFRKVDVVALEFTVVE